jgi:hypothetical protein
MIRTISSAIQAAAAVVAAFSIGPPAAGQGVPPPDEPGPSGEIVGLGRAGRGPAA